MSESRFLREIIAYRDTLMAQMSGPLQLHEPGVRLDCESRRDSPKRMFKYLHQMCFLHSENFCAGSKIKHQYLLDGYIELARVSNPLGLFLIARSMLEFNAFLHEISVQARAAATLAIDNARGVPVAQAEIPNALRRHADETGYRVLRLLGQIVRALRGPSASVRADGRH